KTPLRAKRKGVSILHAHSLWRESGLARSARRNDGHSAAVLAPAALAGVEANRTLFAVGHRVEAARIDAEAHKVILRSISATTAKSEVVLARAALVSMTFKREGQVRIEFHPCSLTLQGRTGVVAQGRAVGVEEDAVANIGHQIFLRARHN